MAKKKPDAFPEPRCGQCKHWRHTENDTSVGECYLNPPVMHFGEEGDFWTSRPVLDATDFACGRFTGSQ